MRDARQLSAMRCSPQTPRACHAFLGGPPAGGEAVKERTSQGKVKPDERVDVTIPVSLANTAHSMGRKNQDQETENVFQNTTTIWLIS